MRSALIGCGAISRNHVHVLKELREETELVALCDVNKEAAEELAREFLWDLPVYTDYLEMLDRVKPDAVHLCTPHFLHAEMAVEALNRGIHVFMEKPVCTTPEQLAALEEAERRSSAMLCICFQNRFLDSSRKAREMISSGEAGKILGARGFVTWDRGGDYYSKSPWRGKIATEGGSVLMNQAIHTLDLILWFMGGVPETVKGAIGNYRNTMNDTEDTAHLYMTFPENRVALFYATTTYCRSARIEWELVCEKKILHFEGPELSVDGEKIVSRQEGSNAGKSVWGKGHGILIREFYRAIREGAPSPVPLAEASVSLRTIWALYDACR